MKARQRRSKRIRGARALATALGAATALGLGFALAGAPAARADAGSAGAPPTAPIATLISTPSSLHSGVELHSHLFMKEGMGWFFRGGFDEPLRASSWKHGFRSMANPEALEESGLRVVVATLYAHPLFVRDVRESVRRQMDQADAFVRAHPNWILARDAESARAAIASGRKVLILALEGASGILENEDDLREFVDRRGLRIVTLLHLTDDHYGGVAFLKGLRAVASPLAWIRDWVKPRREDGVPINSRGLTEAGRDMARALVRRGVWIDLAHASDAAQRELIPAIDAEAGARLPLLYTHTVLRKYYRAERAISDEQVRRVAESHGIVGLIPSEEMLEGTPVPTEMCAGTAALQSGCDLACEGGVRAFAVQYNELSSILPAESIATGSDFNGGLNHLKPGCALNTGLDGSGLWQIGQMAELWKSLEALSVTIPRPLTRSVDTFLSAWAVVRSHAKSR